MKINKDMVDHPAHYADGCSMECIDAMVIAFGASEVISHCKITAFKYLWRHKHKGGQEDVQKALWYLNKAKSLMRGEEPEDVQNAMRCLNKTKYLVSWKDWEDTQIAGMIRQIQVELGKYADK